jgi:hypothetical protein
VYPASVCADGVASFPLKIVSLKFHGFIIFCPCRILPRRVRAAVVEMAPLNHTCTRSHEPSVPTGMYMGHWPVVVCGCLQAQPHVSDQQLACSRHLNLQLR